MREPCIIHVYASQINFKGLTGAIGKTAIAACTLVLQFLSFVYLNVIYCYIIHVHYASIVWKLKINICLCMSM